LNGLTPDSEWIAIDPSLPVLDNNVIIEKSYASAFFATDLGQCLKTLNVDTVIVTGFTTSGCVRASAVDALQWNFKVVVVQDAVGDRNDQAHEANLLDLGLKYADVVGSEEISRI
jgi:nicotinamidase-related amidase